jgi:hypothetical protein
MIRVFLKKIEFLRSGSHEIVHFGTILLKIKIDILNFNIEKITKQLYPNFRFDKSF